MIDEYLNKQYVDHFLQAQIIQLLVTSEKPLRFSKLKEDGVENSLFMYHANKLIDRGLIEKHSQGFQLTIKGARWANFASSSLMNREVLPKTLVQCIIKSEDSVLIANRTGSMKDLLNRYMLPGGTHHFGKTAEECIMIFLNELFSELIDDPKLLTIAEVIITSEDDLISHTISHIFRLNLPKKYEPNNTQLFEYTWMDIGLVKKTNSLFKNSQVVPTIIENQSNLKLHETLNL